MKFVFTSYCTTILETNTNNLWKQNKNYIESLQQRTAHLKSYWLKSDHNHAKHKLIQSNSSLSRSQRNVEETCETTSNSSLAFEEKLSQLQVKFLRWLKFPWPDMTLPFFAPRKCRKFKTTNRHSIKRTNYPWTNWYERPVFMPCEIFWTKNVATKILPLPFLILDCRLLSSLYLNETSQLNCHSFTPLCGIIEYLSIHQQLLWNKKSVLITKLYFQCSFIKIYKASNTTLKIYQNSVDQNQYLPLLQKPVYISIA